MCKELSNAALLMQDKCDALNELLGDISDDAQGDRAAFYYHDSVIPAMEELRDVVDGVEPIVPRDVWPYPGYGELLFSVTM